jgi:hypothetical protein
MNIAMIMYGIDPQTKKFTEPSEQIKKEIAALKADKSVPEADKREGLVQLEAALKDAKPVQFKENIALVLKYFDKLAPIMQEQPVSGCVLSTMPGSRGFLSVDRRSSGRPAACRGCWGVLRAVEDVRAQHEGGATTPRH